MNITQGLKIFSQSVSLVLRHESGVNRLFRCCFLRKAKSVEILVHGHHTHTADNPDQDPQSIPLSWWLFSEVIENRRNFWMCMSLWYEETKVSHYGVFFLEWFSQCQL